MKLKWASHVILSYDVTEGKLYVFTSLAQVVQPRGRVEVHVPRRPLDPADAERGASLLRRPDGGRLAPDWSGPAAALLTCMYTCMYTCMSHVCTCTHAPHTQAKLLCDPFNRQGSISR